MASDVVQVTATNSTANTLDANTDHTTIEDETLKTDSEPKNGLDGVQHRNLTIRTKQTGNDVNDDEGHETSPATKNYQNDCEIDLQPKSEKNIVVPKSIQDMPSEQQSTVERTETPEKDVLIVEYGEIPTTVTSERSIQCEVSKTEPVPSKRHNVFKSIIDRLAQKDGLEHQTKTQFSVGDPQCPGSKASNPPLHPMPCSQNPALLTHAFQSPEPLLFSNASSSFSSSVCSSSSSALNLSFLFRGFPGYDDSGTSLNSEHGISTAALPLKGAHPVAKFHGSSANRRTPAGKKEDQDRVRLHPNEDTLMDDAEMFRNKMEMMDCIMPSDPTESLSGMNRDQPIVYLDLESEETAASQQTCRLGAIKRKYYKSLDYLRKVRVISCTLEKEREKLRLKRQCLQRALHQLRFLYNVTRIRSAKGGSLDRQTISSLWNLAKFEELTKEKQEEEEAEEEQESGECHVIDRRIESGSNKGSSPAHSLNKQESGNYEDEVMQFGCDDDVTNTSLPVDYSLREMDEKTRERQCNVSRAQEERTKGDVPTAFRCINPVETEPPCNQFSRRHHLSLIVDGTTDWRYMNSPPCSAEDQLEEQRTENVVKINSFPAHTASYSGSNRLENRKRTEDYTRVNCHQAHSASSRLEANVGRAPAAAHAMKCDLTNFTYLYCKQNRV